MGKESNVYLVRPIPGDLGGEAYEVEKLDEALNTVEQYHVRLGAPAQTACECLGFLRWSHCKHADGLKALAAKGQLPRLKQKHAACPRCLAYSDAGQLCEHCADEEAEFAAYHQANEMEAAGLQW